MSVQADSLSALIDEIGSMYPVVELLKLVSAETEEEFDHALEYLLENAVKHLEKSANFLNDQLEDYITNFLISYLCGTQLIDAEHDAYSKGHVDITIETKTSFPKRIRLGEAKIYRGPSYHVDGMEQLINRYTTGREGTGFMLEYVTARNIVDLVDKIRKHLDEHRPCAQNGDTQDHRHILWAFESQHTHSSGEGFRVVHLNCNLHTGK